MGKAKKKRSFFSQISNFYHFFFANIRHFSAFPIVEIPLARANKINILDQELLRVRFVLEWREGGSRADTGTHVTPLRQEAGGRKNASGEQRSGVSAGREKHPHIATAVFSPLDKASDEPVNVDSFCLTQGASFPCTTSIVMGN